MRVIYFFLAFIIPTAVLGQGLAPESDRYPTPAFKNFTLRGPNIYSPGELHYSGLNDPPQVALGKEGRPNANFWGTSWGVRWHGGPDFGNTTPVSSQRLIRCTTVSDYKLYESCDSIDFYSRTGYVARWKPSTSYPAGFKAVSSGNVYVAKTAGTSSSTTGPTGTGQNISDGSVVWSYEDFYENGAKAAWSLGAVAFAGSGKVWGMNPNLILGDGFREEAYAMEIDQGNFSGYDAELVNPQFPGVEGIWLGGLYQNTGLSGMSVGGFPNSLNKPMYQIGFWCKNAKAAKFSCYEDWSDSQAGFHTSSFAKKQYDAWAQSTSEVGFYANGGNRTAGFLAEMTGPVGVQVRGAPTFAGIAETSNAPTAINIQGVHSTGGVVDQSTTPSAVRTQGNYGYSAINTQGATGAGGGFALTMANNQKLCFVGQDACFSFDQAAGKLYFATGGVNRFSVDINGNMRAASFTPGTP